jgi:hypothetical protein
VGRDAHIAEFGEIHGTDAPEGKRREINGREGGEAHFRNILVGGKT